MVALCVKVGPVLWEGGSLNEQHSWAMPNAGRDGRWWGVGIPPSLNTTPGGLIQATTGQIYWLAPVLNTMLSHTARYLQNFHETLKEESYRV